MGSTFAGIEMGKSALNAFRLGMQTVGHNISNMNTEGYSRQRVNFATVTPMTLPGVGQVGQGMYANEINRIRDEFLDFQYRNNQATLGYWEKIDSLYTSIQNYIAEPLSSGIRSAMDTFFTNMQTLQQTPEDTSARRSLVESAQSLGSMLSNLTSNFDTYNESINQELYQSVADANKMLHDIAALNKEIYSAEALDQNANDLRDQRDVLIDKLSKMMDISYNEPVEKNGVQGEFFLSLNGRVLVQGTHVRELVAHSFLWDNHVYYDVQVSENEFDIVENCNIADALATGPDGTYQLAVDRLANGVEWQTGGGDAYCLETRRVITSQFENGIILNEDSTDKPYKLSFRVLDEDENPSILTIKIDRVTQGSSTVWQLRAEEDGEEVYYDTDSNDNKIYHYSSGANLTMEELANFINEAVNNCVNVEMYADVDNDRLIFAAEAENSPIEFTDYSGMLGAITEVKAELPDVNMRSRPMNITDALNISGSFRIQVGTQGTRVTSKIFGDNPGQGLERGEILSEGKAGDTYTFRVGVSDEQVDFTVTWNDSINKWVLSSDLGNSKIAGETLTVEDLTGFMSDTFTRSRTSSDTPALSRLNVITGKSSGVDTQFYIESRDNYLLSISDVDGNLASRMGIVNNNPVITIDVESSDSLEIIRNKINEKYQAEFGLTEPEQWVHAALVQDPNDQSWYLTISADVAGEAQRITLMGAEDGNMQVLRRLGLTRNEKITLDRVDDDGDIIESYESFREVAYIPEDGVSKDAAFSLNGVHYLSADNKFSEARRVPATGGNADYSASVLSEVSEGLWLNLKSTGITTINVRHHVKDGTIKGLEEARDGIIPNLKSALDEMAYGLVKNVNAYQYSGYGIASDITTTGVAFFNALRTKANAAANLSVTDAITGDNSLIAAAMGKKDENGRAMSGISGGSGDGTNASRMTGLNFNKVIADGTMSIGGVYDAMLTTIGSEAGHARLMHSTQATVSDQINSQRQAISGVNLDEELMNMVILNRAFGAMSRYISAMDEMLNTIINGFGLVGR